MRIMIIRGSILLPILLSGASAYFAQVNNAHVEFAATGAGSGAIKSVEVVDAVEVTEPEQSVEFDEEAVESADDVAVGIRDISPELIELFEEWIEKFEKEYESLEEKGKRMLVWLENHVLIETHNAQEPTPSFTLGHNEFSDLSHEEFRRRFFLGEFAPELDVLKEKEFKFAPYFDDVEEVKPDNSFLRGKTDESSESVYAVQRKLGSSHLKESEDWSSEGLVGPIRNQGICGACWAFSAVGAIESAMAIEKYNKMSPAELEGLKQKMSVGVEEGTDANEDLGLVVPLSEQDLIDCDTRFEKGCAGGLMITTFEEEEVKNGICSEADYPYHQSQGTCASDLCTPVEGSIVKDHVDVVPRKTRALAEAVLKQPVTAAMVATDPMFQFYKSGIFQKDDCGRVTKTMGDPGCQMLYENQDTCLPDINHGVLVVGYGKDETVDSDIKTYFKVKNSWGNSWGEGGYFRLARFEEDPKDPMGNWGMCAILTMLSYPVME